MEEPPVRTCLPVLCAQAGTVMGVACAPAAVCVCVCLGSMILLCGLTLCGVTKHVASRNMSPHQAFTNCQYDTVSKHASVGTAPLQQVSPMIVGQAVCQQGMSGSLQLGGPGVHREPLHALGWQVIRWVGGR